MDESATTTTANVATFAKPTALVYRHVNWPRFIDDLVHFTGGDNSENPYKNIDRYIKDEETD